MLRRRSSRQALNLRRCGASLPEGPSRSHLHTAIDGTKVYCRPRWVKSHGTAKKRQEHAQMKRENQLSGGDLPEQATDQARPGHSDAQVPADWNGGARRAATEALVVRPRRLRRTAAIRRLVAETAIRPVELVLPLFVKEGIDEPQPVASMPGVVQHTRESLRKAAADAVAAGVGGLILFAIPAVKDERGSAADDAVGIAALALEDLSAEVAGAQAAAGAHVIAPSGMMDGQVRAIRTALDAAGYGSVAICAYSAKYASGFYGPFREAAECAPKFGDRASYQQSPPNSNEALREVLLDIDEGADIVMVKPALAYLDVIGRIAATVNLPVAAYQVSGEYAMVEAAAANGWLDRDRIIMETLTAIRRAGASIILTYWAAEVA